MNTKRVKLHGKVFHQYEPTDAVLAWSFPQTPSHIQRRHEPVAHGCASAFSLRSCPETFLCNPMIT